MEDTLKEVTDTAHQVAAEYLGSVGSVDGCTVNDLEMVSGSGRVKVKVLVEVVPTDPDSILPTLTDPKGDQWYACKLRANVLTVGAGFMAWQEALALQEMLQFATAAARLAEAAAPPVFYSKGANALEQERETEEEHATEESELVATALRKADLSHMRIGHERLCKPPSRQLKPGTYRVEFLGKKYRLVVENEDIARVLRTA